MKKMLLPLSLLPFLLSSCLIDYPVTVTVALEELHPFEELSGAYLWHELTYFDGEEIKTVYVAAGERRCSLQVRSGSLCVFSFSPLGELGAIGGFYEPGDEGAVSCVGDDGSFADLLIYVAEYRPEAVRRLSVRNLRESYPDLMALDEVSFMEDLADGTVYKNQLTLSEKATVTIDSVPSGEWVSERYDVDSFTVNISGRSVSLSLYPGDYHFACFARSMLLEVICTEDGEVSTTITALPEWW